MIAEQLPLFPVTPSEMVREFHVTFGAPIATAPGLPAEHEARLRRDLLEEEFEEYLDAVADHDLVEIADALADMVYIIHGTALVYGIDLDAVVAEVHRSNMSKVGPDGKPIFREDGKVLKGPDFEPPRIADVLGLPECEEGA